MGSGASGACQGGTWAWREALGIAARDAPPSTIDSGGISEGQLKHVDEWSDKMRREIPLAGRMHLFGRVNT